MLYSIQTSHRFSIGSFSALLLSVFAVAPALAGDPPSAVAADASLEVAIDSSVSSEAEIITEAEAELTPEPIPTPVVDRVILSSGVVSEGQVMLIGDKKQWDTFVGADPIASASGYLVVEPDADLQAIKARWNGKGEAQFFVAHASPTDYSQDLAHESALVMLLQVLEKPKKKVLLRMGCGYPCASNADITKLLKALPPKEWIRLSFDLQCFVDGGLDVTHVDTPLLITSKGKMALLISDVRIAPGMGSQATISCR